jgi:hypothetical protein
MVLAERQTQAVEVVVLNIVVLLVHQAVQESSLFPTHLQLNYLAVELLLYQAVNISIPLLLLVH